MALKFKPIYNKITLLSTNFYQWNYDICTSVKKQVELPECIIRKPVANIIFKNITEINFMNYYYRPIITDDPFIDMNWPGKNIQNNMFVIYKLYVSHDNFMIYKDYIKARNLWMKHLNCTYDDLEKYIIEIYKICIVNGEFVINYRFHLIYDKSTRKLMTILNEEKRIDNLARALA